MTPNLGDVIAETRLKFLKRGRSIGEIGLNCQRQTVEAIVLEHREVYAAVVVGPVIRIIDRRPRQSGRGLGVECLREIHHRGEQFVGQSGREDPCIVRRGSVHVNVVQYTAARSIHRSHNRARRIVRNLRLALAFLLVGIASEDVVVVVESIVDALSGLKNVIVHQILDSVVVAVRARRLVR